MANSTDFVMAVKSTLDKLAKDAADGLGAAVLDLDTLTNVSEVADSRDAAVLFRFITLDEDPKDPMWTFTFEVGAKTTSDPGSYTLVEMIEALRPTFKQGADIDFYDYGGAVVSDNKVGFGTVTEFTVEPQIFSGAAGIRLFMVRARLINLAYE